MILPTLLAALASGTALQAAQPPVPLLDHRKLSVAASKLVTEHPDLLSLLPVGESRGGRRIEALRVAAGERIPGRPAILVVACLDGPWAWTSGLALYDAQKLVEGYATDPKIRDLLDTTTIYVVPRANPDGAEARFEEPLREREATGAGVDDDRDGESGENDADDVDGDGKVAWMRVPDPEGEWIADPTDARALVRADRSKGERGVWKLFPEGRDTDGDELVAEDPVHDAVVNRNFPQLWEEHVPAAGRFPTDEPEARALCDFVLLHPDVALVVTYGALDNLVEKPKAVADDARPVKRVPPDEMLQSDADLLAEIGRRYAAITGSKARGTGTERGSFQAWCYAERGLWTLEIAPWSIPLDTPAPPAGDKGGDKTDDKGGDQAGDGGGDRAGGADKAAKKADEPKPSDDAKRLRWIDAQGETARFLPWKAFEHPELGPVEIGGFAPYALCEPPEAERAAIAEKQLEFLISLGAVLPRVRVVDCKAHEVHAGLFKIEAAVESAGLLPVLGKAAVRARTPRPVRVRLELPAGARLVAGEPERLLRELDAGGWRTELTWLVLGADPTALRVSADTDHAGVARAVPEVVR
jgi:Zinc carboxypeptidase